jgi:hypothetical protein
MVKHLRFMNVDSRRILANVLGVTLTLGTCAASHAGSALASISVEPQWPTNSQPGLVVLYAVTVTRAGHGNLEVELSSAGLPPGVTATFSVNPVRFTGRTPTSRTSILTLTCTNLVATDNWPFTVTGTHKQGVTTVTNQPAQTGTLGPLVQPLAAPSLALEAGGKTAMTLRGQGASGQTYQIQSTSSLGASAWAGMGSSTADGNGRFTFQDSDPNLPPMRFYRTVLPAGGQASTP